MWEKIIEKPRIYLETTIFNFPFADDAPELKADTLKLFDEIKAGKHEPYTSIYALEELENTKQTDKLVKMRRLIDAYSITIIPVSKEAERLATLYLAEGIINKKYRTDAYHIAITAVYELDFIVSLNFQHIVKPKTIRETAQINEREGYKQIGIYEPAELINGKDD
jgi:predicted nucleic acid-binding protein